MSWSGPHGLSLTPPLSSPDNSARWTACLSSPPPAPTNTKRGGNWDRQGHPACLLSSSWVQRSVGRGAAVLPTTASQFATQRSVERDAPPLLRLGLLNAYLTPASSARAKFQAGDRRLQPRWLPADHRPTASSSSTFRATVNCHRRMPNACTGSLPCTLLHRPNGQANMAYTHCQMAKLTQV